MRRVAATVALTGARHELAALWDEATDRFLEGAPLPDELRRWQEGYRGQGVGAVDVDALPEPYLGRLDREPSMIFLALNPGRVFPLFQHRHGVFPAEIRALGSYSAWAGTWPFLRDSWLSGVGHNLHHASRLRFMQRWLRDESLGGADMLALELYPWHSTGITAPMNPDPGIIRDFVWRPIAEFKRPLVFAFGAPWFPLLEHHLRLPVIDRLGPGGRAYASKVSSRAVVVMRSAEGAIVVAEKHSGSAGPPSGAEVELLRAALGDHVG